MAVRNPELIRELPPTRLLPKNRLASHLLSGFQINHIPAITSNGCGKKILNAKK